MTPFAVASERRISIRLLGYWEKLRRGRDIPEEADIKPDDILDLWDSCLIVHPVGGEYSYKHLGLDLTESYLFGLPPESGRLPTDTKHLVDSYDQVMKSAKPLIDEGQIVLLDGTVIKYRQCLLPLGKNGKVEAIFGGMRYKVFSG